MFILALPSMFWGNSITHPVILQKAENPPSAILPPLQFSIRQVQEEEWLITAGYMSQTSVHLSEPPRNSNSEQGEAEAGRNRQICQCIWGHSHPRGHKSLDYVYTYLVGFPKNKWVWELGYFLEQSKHWFRGSIIKLKPNVFTLLHIS